MKTTVLFLLPIILLTSCASQRAICKYEMSYGPNASVPWVTAYYSPTPIKLDGVLDEEIWKKSPAYSMVEPIDVPESPKAESKFSMKWKDFYGGTVKFAYTDDTLYIAAKVKDGDIVQFNQKDQQPHWKSGDLIEIMIKSANAPGFWECYGTPCGHRTTIHYIARGYCSETMNDFRDDFKIGVKLDGTLNDRKDIDNGYTMEIAIPFKMLEALDGVPFNDKGNWKIFIGRYNYDWRYSYRQLSCYPMMPVPKFETNEYFSPIILLK